ncbi:hypothetical protein Tco_0106389 [Tanacetum coccineum]
MPVCDDFTTFSNLLFDANDDFSSSDDESFPDEDVPNKIYSNPLFDEEIISVKIDASIISMIDSLVEQFSGEFDHFYDMCDQHQLSIRMPPGHCSNTQNAAECFLSPECRTSQPYKFVTTISKALIMPVLL